MQATYPPFPWRLRPANIAVGTLHTVRLEMARRHVPPSVPLLSVWPGRTLGGLFLVHYGPGSVLEYHELAACAAVVRHGGRPCAWVTHVYVDDVVSLRGGREAIGVPKELARFVPVASEPGAMSVVRDGRPICTIRPGRLLPLLRLRVRFCAMHRHTGAPGTISVHGNEVAGRILLGRAGVEVPDESPLRALGLGRPLVALGLGDGDALLGGAPSLPFRTLPEDTA